MDLTIATQIPFFENGFWIYLPDSFIRVDWNIVNTHKQCSVIVALHQVLRLRRAWKDLSHAQVMLDVALKSHEHLGTSQREDKKSCL